MRKWLLALGLLLAGAGVWLATTENAAVWPARNTLQYQVLHWLGATGPQGMAPRTGVLSGTVRDAQGQPIAGATVLLAARDGTTYQGHSGADGAYRVGSIPVGRYVPVAGAPGYEQAALRRWGLPLAVPATGEALRDVVLQPLAVPPLASGTALAIGAPETLSCQQPLASSAVRREISFLSDGRPNQQAFVYTPVTGTLALPTILAVYPGPAAGWECASLPLAQAGYAVLAVGPAYALDLEADVDELARLLAFAREGRFARADGSRLAVVAGSYSGLHVQRLLQRDRGFRAALLLGPPTDLFDMRRRLEDRSFVPPFGLDAALIALGLPDHNPERYWRYSGAYHVDAAFPPLALLHSRSDDVVPWQQSELLAARLHEAGATYETHFFEGASHYLLGAEGQGDAQDTLEVYRLTLEFLGRYLNNP